MEPALAFAALVAVVSSLWLMMNLGFDAVVALSRRDADVSTRFKSSIAAMVAVLVLLSSVKAGSAIAATPPAVERIAGMDSSRPASVDVLNTTNTDELEEPIGDVPDPMLKGSYTVVSGDCLWRIAKSVISDINGPHRNDDAATLWRAIYQQNRDLIGPNPNLILPGQVLEIPGA